MIAVIGPKDKNPDYKGWVSVNTTTSSDNWSRELSPMVLGPVKMFKNLVAKRLENAWQYLKVYKNHLDDQGNILLEYYVWARQGFRDPFSRRYPMGKGAVPEFSLWNGERLDYISARKKIYIPLYREAVRKSEAYKKLLSLYKESGNMVLFDFDGYDYLKLGLTLNQVLNDPTKKMGHGFVLAMMLEEDVDGKPFPDLS